MPVTGSNFVLSCAIVHDGVIRRSDEAALEEIKSGMSRVVTREEGISEYHNGKKRRLFRVEQAEQAFSLSQKRI